MWRVACPLARDSLKTFTEIWPMRNRQLEHKAIMPSMNSLSTILLFNYLVRSIHRELLAPGSAERFYENGWKSWEVAFGAFDFDEIRTDCLNTAPWESSAFSAMNIRVDLAALQSNQREYLLFWIECSMKNNKQLAAWVCAMHIYNAIWRAGDWSFFMTNI